MAICIVLTGLFNAGTLLPLVSHQGTAHRPDLTMELFHTLPPWTAVVRRLARYSLQKGVISAWLPLLRKFSVMWRGVWTAKNHWGRVIPLGPDLRSHACFSWVSVNSLMVHLCVPTQSHRNTWHCHVIESIDLWSGTRNFHFFRVTKHDFQTHVFKLEVFSVFSSFASFLFFVKYLK